MANEALSPESKKTGFRVSRARILYSVILLLFLIAGTSSWLIYHWQHQQVENLTSNLSEANKKANTSETALLNEIKDNSSATSTLQKNYQEALVKLNAATTINTTSTSLPTQEDLDLTVDKAVTAVMQSGPGGIDGIAIELTLKNSTSSTISEGPTNYQIKDANNNIYGLQFLDWGGFGKDFAPILVNDIQPGQTITGSIFIQIADANVTNYTLFIGSHTYSVTATKLTSYPATN